MLTANKIINIVYGLIIAATVANCSPRSAERKRSFSDDAVKTATPESTNLKAQKNERLEAALSDIEPFLVSQITGPDDAIDPNGLMSKVILPLKEIILNVDSLAAPENRFAKTDEGRFIMPRLVSLFNQALLLVNKTEPSLIAGTNIITQYKQVLLWDCSGASLEGSCQFIKYFRKTDGINMGKIVKLMHDQEGTSDYEKMRLIRAGLEVKNRRLDSSLRFMLLERIAQSSLQGVDNKAIDYNHARFVQEVNLFANVLNISGSEIQSDNGYISLIEALNPWKLSRNVDDAKNPAMSNIIKIASEKLLYKEDGSLSDLIKNEVIPSLLYKLGDDFEQGVLFQKANLRGEWKPDYDAYLAAKAEDKPMVLSDLQKELFPIVEESLEIELYGDESKGILKTLLSDVSFEEDSLDEYFYLAHQAFYAHFSLEDATAFWGGTKKDSSRLMNELEKLLKVQIVNNIVLTNTRMNNFYNRNENTKLIELLRESDKEASKIRKAWSKTIVRAQTVKSLITRVINPNSLSGEDRRAYDRINSSIDALKKNIKFLATYPNMFPLMHVMASLDMKDSISWWGRKFTIDSATIISNFFAGYFPPWFNFGNDSDSLDPVEIVYTYYYALVTQTFETYSTSSIVNFSHADFFKVVVKRLILDEEEDLDDKRRALLKDIEDYKNNAVALKRMCDEEANLQRQEKQELEKLKESLGEDFDWYEVMKNAGVMKRRLQVKNQFGFVDMSYMPYDGTNNKTDKVGRYLHELYSSNVLNVISKMRTSFPRKSIVAETIVEVFKSTKGGEQSEIDKIVEDQFSEYNRLKSEYIKIYNDAEKDFRSCDWLFLARDRDIRHMLVFREVEYLGALFDEVWEVLSPLTKEQRANLSSSDEVYQQLEEIKKKYSTYTQDDFYTQDRLKPGFPAEYQERFGYNTISPSRLTSFKMDTAARVYAYFQELFPGEYSISMPADFKTTGIYAEASPALVYFDWEKSKEASKEEFIKSGIKALADQMTWAGGPPSVATIVNKGEILVNLFKLGTLTKDVDVDCASESLSEEMRAENCVRVSAKEIIEHFKKAIHFLNLDDRDLELLDLLGKENKYAQSQYEDFIKRQDEHRLYSFYDMIFRRIYSDSRVKDSEVIWFKDTLVSYVNSVHKIQGSTFIFPYSDRLNEIFVEKYSGWLEQYYKQTEEFLNEVKVQLAEGVEPFQFKYRTDRSHRIGLESNDWSTNKNVSLEPLVSDLIYGKFEGFSQQMNNDTSGYFSPIVWKYTREIQQLAKPIADDSQGDQ